MSKSEYVKSFSVSQVEGFLFAPTDPFKELDRYWLTILASQKCGFLLRKKLVKFKKKGVVSVETNGSLLRDMITLCQES